MKIKIKISLFLAGIFLPFWVSAHLIQVLAAENFYGDVAQQLGQPYVAVTSVLMSPQQDPHLFSSSPQVAIAVDHAEIIIENGLGYDAWMDHLISASSQKARCINVAALLHAPPGANPHIWYDPAALPIFAAAYIHALIALDPLHRAVYEKNWAVFKKQAGLYQSQVDHLGHQIAGLKMSATEPVFNDLALALHLTILNQAFAWSQMNGSTLSPQLMIAFDRSLETHETQLLIYNKQVSSSITQHLRLLALKNHIPVVGVSELMPTGMHYYSWMKSQLDELASALGVQ